VVHADPRSRTHHRRHPAGADPGRVRGRAPPGRNHPGASPLLSVSEWGVPFETVAIAIPFYLAHPDLTALHAERVGHVEGFDRTDILRYLRHEMGHMLNYAYRLYDQEEWVKQFGSITQPYFGITSNVAATCPECRI